METLLRVVGVFATVPIDQSWVSYQVACILAKGMGKGRVISQTTRYRRVLVDRYFSLLDHRRGKVTGHSLKRRNQAMHNDPLQPLA